MSPRRFAPLVLLTATASLAGGGSFAALPAAGQPAAEDTTAQRGLPIGWVVDHEQPEATNVELVWTVTGAMPDGGETGIPSTPISSRTKPSWALLSATIPVPPE